MIVTLLSFVSLTLALCVGLSILTKSTRGHYISGWLFLVFALATATLCHLKGWLP